VIGVAAAIARQFYPGAVPEDRGERATEEPPDDLSAIAVGEGGSRAATTGRIAAALRGADGGYTAGVLTSGEFVARVAEWVATFNRGSLDLPDGLLHKDAIFRLNGTAYDEMLGRPSTDPLVRLVARGPGGYRLLCKALQYTLGAPEIALRNFEARHGLATGHVDVSGRLRDTDEAWVTNADVVMTIDIDGHVTELAVQMDDAAIARLGTARRA